MSPEQVQGFELDNRSDLFSLGFILYQTLTGQLPFFAESALEVATKIVIEDPVPPSKMRSDWSFPPELESVDLRLLSKKKEERYRNAIKVKEDLEKCLDTLRERRDASLDLNPDELAELMADADDQVEGAATLQLSSDMIAKAMAAEALVAKPAAPAARPAAQAAPADAPPPAAPRQPEARPASAPLPRMMTGPTTSFREEAPEERSGNTGMMVGVGVAILAALGAGAWWFFMQ